MSSIIINNIPNIENFTYLELGVFNNENFNKIKSKNKHSVDLNGNAMFTGSTDEYFSSLTKETNFDIIFIDACHDYEFVVRDFNNSVERCNCWILMHDMIPPAKKYTESRFCSDSYKLLYYFLTATDFTVYPMNNNFGLTLIKMPATRVKPPKNINQLDYNTFMAYLDTQKLYSDEEIIDILRK